MDSIDLTLRERRARRKYEWARLRRAFWGFAPSLLLVLGAALANKHPSSALMFGSGMFLAGLFLLWYGRDARRAVLPGVALGLLPLALALCANHWDHTCTGSSCTSLCVPACTLGGLGAGIGVALLGARRQSRGGFWLAGSAVALLTGSMGCSCAGYAGVVGLISGYVVGMVPVVANQLARRTPG